MPCQLWSFTRALVASVLLVMLCTDLSAQDAEKFSLTSGNYTLQLTMPNAPKDQGKVSHQTKVTVGVPDKNGVQSIELETQTTVRPFKKVMSKGIVKGNKIKIYTGEIERETVIAFHYIGELPADDQAKGKMTMMVDGQTMPKGEWKLTKDAEEKK